MKSHHIAFAALSLVLAACTAPEPPASPQPAVDAPAAGAAPAAKRAPGSESVDPLWIFRAFGTEPFWNVKVEGATLTYTTPENQAGTSMQGERHATAGGVEITGNHENTAFALTIAHGECSDGMSDNTYQLVSTFRYGDAEFKGCAEAAK